VFLERTQILSGIQFTTYFIDLFVVETKRFVDSFVHVILTRQTCGQRSSRTAESKRRALGNYFSERICYMFSISKCRGDRDLGLCTTVHNSARRLLSAVLLERWPQVCRVKITCTELLTNRFVSTTKNSMKCVVNWIPLRTRVRSRNTQPHFNENFQIFKGLSTWPILKFVGKDILKFVGNCRRALSMVDQRWQTARDRRRVQRQMLDNII